ncbi:MAG: hypothetical protein WC966_10870 [Bradymonadales bacterium]
MLEIIKIIGAVVSALSGLSALVLMAIKPFRQWILGGVKARARRNEELERAKETDRCLLRNEIISIYYKHQRDGEIKQYAYENMALLYRQYKRLDGNSFVDRAWEEAQDWTILKN